MNTEPTTEPAPCDDFLTQLLIKARGNKIAPGQMGLFGAPPEPAPSPVVPPDPAATPEPAPIPVVASSPAPDPVPSPVGAPEVAGAGQQATGGGDTGKRNAKPALFPTSKPTGWEISHRDMTGRVDEHVHPSGWKVRHCGHATAVRPWAAYSPDGLRAEIKGKGTWSSVVEAKEHAEWAAAQPAPAEPAPREPDPSTDDKRRPPGKGWMPIPHSYYRGMHRVKPGGGFEYWYPGQGVAKPMRQDRRRIDPHPPPVTPPMGHVPTVKVPARLDADMPRMSFQQAQEQHGAANAAAHHVVYGKQLQRHFSTTHQQELTSVATDVMQAIVEAMRQEKPKTKFEDIPPLKTPYDAENYFRDNLLKRATKILGRERLDAISVQHMRDMSPDFDAAADSVWDMILGQEESSVFHKSGSMHDVYRSPGGNQPSAAVVVESLRKRGFSAYVDENGSVHANVSPLAPVGAWARKDQIAPGAFGRHDEDSLDAHQAINGGPPDPGQEDTDGHKISDGTDGTEAQISPFGVRNHSYGNQAARFSFPSVDHAAEAAPWHRAQQQRMEADEQQLRAEHPEAFTHEDRPLNDPKLWSARRRAHTAHNHAQAHGQIADAAEKYLKLKKRQVPK